jgi:glycosyltransferase involved in cell wall biosynthesis
MPKILFVSDSLAMGGAERQLTLLIKYLPSPWAGNVVAFGGGTFAQKIDKLGVSLTIFERSSRFDLKPVWSFWKLLRNLRPDIVHSWSWMSSAIAAPMCKLLGIKFINGCIRRGTSPARNILRARMAFYLSDRIIANSYAGLNACGISSSKGRVIYNAIDPQRLILMNEKKRITETPITVVMAARMAAVKDFKMFINGAREINRIDPGNWKFIALGDGPDKEKLIEQSADLISAGVMEFPGVMDDVMPYLPFIDMGVLLTCNKGFEEGFSNSIMEYMACGLPVVCSNSGGNRELIIPDETGFLLESNNVQDFVEKLLWLKHHPSEARQMGCAGMERITQLCSIERMVDEYVEVYRDVLDIKVAVSSMPQEKIKL